MSFIDSYKHLEKICGEIMDADRRLSAYIDEMEDTSNGSYYVKNWDDDLKTLKHYRWVRNQIVHEPDCNEADMCDPDDEVWLDNFYSRIINQTDPLTLYRKARLAQKASRSRTQSSSNGTPTPKQIYVPHEPKRTHNFAPFIFCGIVLLIIIIWFFNK